MSSPASKPIFLSASSLITPEAASRPKAEPPLKTTALTAFTVFSLLRRSVSLVAGPPPLTSTPPTAPSSQTMTVHPVPFSLFSALPSLNPFMSVTLIIFIAIGCPSFLYNGLFINYTIIYLFISKFSTLSEKRQIKTRNTVKPLIDALSVLIRWVLPEPGFCSPL